MSKYLNTELVDVERVAHKLFDFSQLGAVAVPDVLRFQARTDLLRAIHSAKDHFKQSEPLTTTGVTQDMGTLYLEKVKIGDLPFSLVERLQNLVNEYLPLYNRFAEVANFTDTPVNSLGIHKYPQGSAGISPHRDYASEENLITSFILTGDAPFYVCEDREKTGAQQLSSEPGTLIFMRAARDESEQEQRPFHYVEGPLKSPRCSILFRCKNNHNSSFT